MSLLRCFSHHHSRWPLQKPKPRRNLHAPLPPAALAPFTVAQLAFQKLQLVSGVHQDAQRWGLCQGQGGVGSLGGLDLLLSALIWLLVLW